MERTNYSNFHARPFQSPAIKRIAEILTRALPSAQEDRVFFLLFLYPA